MSVELGGDIIDKLLRAGEVVFDVLSRAVDIVEEGVEVAAICKELEEAIAKKGARPAFPVNVSINDVAAHYTAAPGDKMVIPPRSVVKIDVGAHVDGYIADSAVTVVLDRTFEPLARAAYEALRAAMKSLRHGIRLGAVGAIIEREIKLRGFKPISRELDNLLSNIWSEFRGLPFASRWVAERWGDRALDLLRTLERKRRVYHYRVLVERGGGYVAQFEDTVIVQENGALPLVGVSKLVKG